jgi:hypothetical protein
LEIDRLVGSSASMDKKLEIAQNEVNSAQSQLQQLQKQQFQQLNDLQEKLTRQLKMQKHLVNMYLKAKKSPLQRSLQRQSLKQANVKELKRKYGNPKLLRLQSAE